VTSVGATGGGSTEEEDGVTGALGAEGGPFPVALVAITVKVYGVPFVSPVTVHDVDAVVHVAPPGVAVTV
jgi:hypothetical protein